MVSRVCVFQETEHGLVALVGGACEGVATRDLLKRLIVEPWDFDSCSILSNIDEGVRKIAAHQNTASELNTFPDNMRMKFVRTITLLSTQHVEVW